MMNLLWRAPQWMQKNFPPAERRQNVIIERARAEALKQGQLPCRPTNRYTLWYKAAGLHAIQIGAAELYKTGEMGYHKVAVPLSSSAQPAGYPLTSTGHLCGFQDQTELIDTSSRHLHQGNAGLGFKPKILEGRNLFQTDCPKE